MDDNLKTLSRLWKASHQVSSEQPVIARDIMHTLSSCIWKEDVGIEVFHKACRRCGAIFNATNSSHRIKPKSKVGKNTQTALGKYSKSRSKKTKRLVRKFNKASPMLVTHCTSCSYIHTSALCRREDICRSKQMKPAHIASTPKRLNHGSKSLPSSVESKRSSSRTKRRHSSRLSSLLKESSSITTNLQDFLSNL